MSKVITLFGSARVKENSVEWNYAYNIGKKLAEEGYTVCNGGYSGIMEASAKGAVDASGRTIGVISNIFSRRPNEYIQNIINSKNLYERIAGLVQSGDGYVVLKGGTGTLVEIAMVWEMVNKGLIPNKPIVAVSPFWDNIVNQFKEELAWEGDGDCTKHVSLATTPDDIINYLNIFFDRK
jgi:uncharacterized protein (TIGR00725 family)